MIRISLFQLLWASLIEYASANSHLEGLYVVIGLLHTNGIVYKLQMKAAAVVLQRILCTQRI